MKAIILGDGTAILRDDLTDDQVYQQYTDDVADIIDIGEKIFYKPRYENGDIIESLSLDDAKGLIKNKVREVASASLTKTDWKMIRHRDQADAGVATSLTAEEYTDLLAERESIRGWSNKKESDIDLLTSVHDVMTFEVE